jgi:hypothetical protein
MSEAQRLMTYRGVGPLTALVFVLIIGQAKRFPRGKQQRSISGWSCWKTMVGTDEGPSSNTHP